MGLKLPASALRSRRQLLAIGAIAVVIIGLLAFLAVDRAAHSVALEAARKEAEGETAILAASLESELEKFSLVPLVLAEDPQVRNLVSGSADQKPILNQRLEEIASQTGAAAIYLMDSRGLTLAASNWNRPDSFVGSNYGFRRYFTAAVEQGSASQFALGTVSRRPGLYIAKRVVQNGKTTGVVAIKVEFDELETSWRDATRGVFVTDADGVVLITSNPDWRFTTTRSAAGKTRDSGEDLRQFGLSQLKPISLAGDQRMIVTPMLETREALSPVGWEIHLLADPSPRLAAARANGRLMLLLGIAAIAALALFAHLVSRRRAARAEMLVQERTAKLRDQLQQANRLATLGQITAGVGHEIRQPLAAMRVYAENGVRLLDDGDQATASENFAQIVSLTDRLGKITDELRRFSRRGRTEPKAMAIGQVIDSALLLLHDRMTGQDTILDLPLPDCLGIEVRGEHVALEQVLVNLIQNALDATGQGGHLTISIDREGTNCRLSVADNGPGIPPDRRESLFQPFATSKTSGLGLGLVISQDIMRGLGGDLIAEDSDSGARFTMVIPRA